MNSWRLSSGVKKIMNDVQNWKKKKAKQQPKINPSVCEADLWFYSAFKLKYQ